MNNNNFSERLKFLRQKLSISQEAMAALLGVTLMTVHRWETNKARPSQLAIRQIERLEKKHVNDCVK